jgi:cytoskeleton protein RodZ
MSEDKTVRAVQDLVADLGQVSSLEKEVLEPVLEPVLEDTMDVGQQLRAAREARGISMGEAAEKLKLSIRQVQEMETNDWSHLPRTVFRGFVRNYARHLELEVEPLMEALDRVEMPRGPELAVGTPSGDMPREGEGDRRDYARVAAGLIVLALALLAVFFIPAETWRSALDAIKSLVSENKLLPKPSLAPEGVSGKAPETVSSAPAPVAAGVITMPAMLSMPVAAASETARLPPVVETPAAPPAAFAASATDSGEGTLVFSFNDSSWVEVRDRGGQILLSQTSPPGSRREVAGQAPFSLVIGKASHVTLQYQGKPVDLMTQRSKDDVARLTLE